MYTILVINPGSTSTKVALYEDQTELMVKTLDHPKESLRRFDRVQDQYGFRKQAIMDWLEESGVVLRTLKAVVGRGGLLPPVKSGAYHVNELMVDRLKNRPVVEHASNLGALIAYEIAVPLGIPALIYDSVAVDELSDVARISGLPQLPRASFSHALNARAMAHQLAQRMDRAYGELNLIVAHLGGGISVSAHEKGRLVDILSDDEGPFSPERAGRVPCGELVNLCFSGTVDHKTMRKLLRGNGGLFAYLGTVDAREIERRIEAGDDQARTVYQAMAYQVAKGIGELATVLMGEVDAIILTGGIAHSKRLTDWIIERVAFLAPVEVMAGEYEVASLAQGAWRVLSGQEHAREYKEGEA